MWRETGILVAVMLDYWLASKLGRVWLSLHKGLRPALGTLPGECALVARGQELTAGRLYRAQRFGVLVWWRAGMVAVLLLLPATGLGAALRPGRIGTDVIVDFMILAGGAAGVSIAQMGLLFVRSGLIRWYLVKTGPKAAEEPLPKGSPGQPTRWDFWVMLIIAVAIFGILVYAATRP